MIQRVRTRWLQQNLILWILCYTLSIGAAMAQMPSENPMSGEGCPIIPCSWSGCDQCDSNCYTCGEIDSTCGYTCDEAVQKLESDCNEICIPFTPTPTATPTLTPTATPTATPVINITCGIGEENASDSDLNWRYGPTSNPQNGYDGRNNVGAPQCLIECKQKIEQMIRNGESARKFTCQRHPAAGKRRPSTTDTIGHCYAVEIGHDRQPRNYKSCNECQTRFCTATVQ